MYRYEMIGSYTSNLLFDCFTGQYGSVAAIAATPFKYTRAQLYSPPEWFI